MINKDSIPIRCKFCNKMFMVTVKFYEVYGFKEVTDKKIDYEHEIKCERCKKFNYLVEIKK